MREHYATRLKRELAEVSTKYEMLWHSVYSAKHKAGLVSGVFPTQALEGHEEHYSRGMKLDPEFGTVSPDRAFDLLRGIKLE